MNIAIIYDYLITYGGGERMLEVMHELYPQEPIYSLMYLKDELPDEYRSFDIRPLATNKLPFKKKFFKYYIPFFPVTVESADLRNFDMVVSITAGFAKGVVLPIETCHVSYTLTVPRFLWGY